MRRLPVSTIQRIAVPGLVSPTYLQYLTSLLVFGQEHIRRCNILAPGVLTLQLRLTGRVPSCSMQTTSDIALHIDRRWRRTALCLPLSLQLKAP